MAKGALLIRTPDTRWLILAAVMALCLHGFCWYVTRTLLGDGPEALSETQRQMCLAMAWMIGALVIWKMSVPPSRLHAILTVLTCALFLTLLGSAAAFIKLIFVDHAVVTGKLVSSFLTLGGLLVVAQLVLAIPSAIVLQAVALRRAPPA